MSLKYKLKGLIISQGFTMSQVNDELNRRHGTNFTFQNFSNRFRKETFTYNYWISNCTQGKIMQLI